MKRENTWLWLIIIAGSLLRLYRLDFQSLWYDEGLQYVVSSTNNPLDLFGKTQSFHPPLSFLINYLFLSIHSSDFFLRLPSALFGIGSLPLFYMLANKVSSKRTAIFALLVFAISPLHVWYSQDGRMYAQLLFLMLLSTVLLFKALQHGELRWWIVYIFATTAGMYTHVFMALAVIVQCGWVILCHRRHLASVSASMIAVSVLFLPWILFLPWVKDFLHSLSSGSIGTGSVFRGQAGFSWGALPYTFFVYSGGFSLGPTVAELHNNRSLEFILQFLPVIVMVAAIFGPLLAIGIYAMAKHSDVKALVLCLLGLSIPLTAVMAYSLAPSGTFNVRYTLVAFPYFCIFIGAALSFMSHVSKIAVTVTLLAVLSISAASLSNYFTNPRYAKEDVRSAVTFWKYVSKGEPLISFRERHTTNRYLDESERRRHFQIGSKNVVSSINQILSAQATSSAYIILGRDWKQIREKIIRNAFIIDNEQSYPGVKVFRILPQESLKSVTLCSSLCARSYRESVIASRCTWLGNLLPTVAAT